MKSTLSCVYWILLLISVVSSGLLFIIVASEGIKGSKDVPVNLKVSHLQGLDNVTIDDSGGGNTDSSVVFPNQIEVRKATEDTGEILNNEKKEMDQSDPLTLEMTNGEKEVERSPSLEFFGDVSTQQPNLSQGVPDTDQAVVLTLVDAAAAELQSLAEPRMSLQEGRADKSVVGNLTLSMVSETTQLTPSSSSLPALANLDPDDIFETGRNLTLGEQRGEPIPAGAVEKEEEEERERRHAPDQTGGSKIEEGEVASAEEPKSAKEEVETASELPENEARVRFAGGSIEDAGVMLDILVTGAGTDPHEDIPSFSEWAQKRLEEAEKKKTHPNASAQNPGGPGGRGTGSTKVRSKNYASPDCGAKVVAANPEAGSASSVLSSSRDEYMLNTCTSRVWFIVELCEAIQAEKIELANFELFSSSPRDFSAFVGDRFPSRDWSAVGQFTAKDERDIQSFALHPRLFGKFVKVELHSHYGSEHFCPISLFRVYGTSEFEVLETENQIQESLENGNNDDDDDGEDEEEMLDVGTGEPPRNLFGSARDAVLSIVKKAAEVLVKSGDNSKNKTMIRANIGDDILRNSLAASCTTPRYNVICNDCAEATFAEVFRLVSCNDRRLASFLRNEFVNETLRRSDFCLSYGLRPGDAHPVATKNDPGARFLSSLFPPAYLVALCNVFAARESKVVVNASYYVTGNKSEGAAILEGASIAPPQGVSTVGESQTPSAASSQVVYCTSDDGSSPCKTTGAYEQQISQDEFSTLAYPDASPSPDNLVSLIKPTKTLAKNDGSRKEPAPPPPPLLEPSRRPAEQSTFFDAPTTASPMPNHQATHVDKFPEDSGTQGVTFETTSHTATPGPPTESSPEIVGDVSGDMENGAETTVPETTATDRGNRYQPTEATELDADRDQLSLDTLLSDLKDLEVDAATLQNNPAAPSATLSHPTPTHQQKESVFLRLSNRIKTLERNMSLSGQYLEELSKRYKKQVEEMQRSLERAVAAMSEESRRGEEREARRLEEIADMKEQVLALSRSLNALLGDRDSWRSKFSLIGQHVVLVCVEIVIVLVVLSYCRRTGDLDDDAEVSSEPRVTRRKSVEGTNGCAAEKKTKKRRPSEIAVHISGTYRELLIDDSVAPGELAPKERKKKKKKRDSTGKAPIVTASSFQTARPLRGESFGTLPGGTDFPSRRASSSDAAKYTANNSAATDAQRRPESAPETSSGWFADQEQPRKIAGSTVSGEDDSTASSFQKVVEIIDPRSCGIEHIAESKSLLENAEGDPRRKVSLPSKSGGILKNRRLSSPAFMKTALGARSKRLSGGGNSSTDASLVSKSENFERFSKSSENRSSHEDDRESPIMSGRVNGLAALNGRHEDSDDSIARSVTPTSGSAKGKRTYGLKKMVKKLF